MNWGSGSSFLENQRKIGAGVSFLLDGSPQLARQNVHDLQAQRLRLVPIDT
jgi:hypothetical protein